MIRHARAMTTWHELHHDAPELAQAVRARFEATGLALLATLRADGSPRISGVEPWFARGELWLGMMWGSRKARDLQRDGRFALHAATADKAMTEGDAKVAGRAVEVTDEAAVAAARRDFGEINGAEPPPGPMHLFRLDLTEAVRLEVVHPDDDTPHMRITTWHPGTGVRTVRRA
jgi:hypothetical protein